MKWTKPDLKVNTLNFSLTQSPTYAHNLPTMKKQTEPMIRVHMHITKKLDDELRELSEKTGASVAWLIRKAIEAYLAGQK